jgi:hypothetical protein
VVVVNGLVDVLMKGRSRGEMYMYMYMEQHNEGE